MSLRPQRNEDLPDMNPFTDDFSLFGDDSDDGLPAAKSILCGEHDRKVLRDFRRTLASKFTTFYRYQSLCEWYNLFDPNGNKSRRLRAIFEVTQGIAERTKEDINAHDIVKMHDQVNTHTSLTKLAMNDGLFASMQIAATDPDDPEKTAPIHFKVVFNNAMAECLVNWQPCIADVETPQQRYDRQMSQWKKFKKAAEARESWMEEYRGNANQRFKRAIITCDESELDILIKGEAARRRRRDVENFEHLKAKGRAVREGKGKLAEVGPESGFESEAESETTVTSDSERRGKGKKKAIAEDANHPMKPNRDSRPSTPDPEPRATKTDPMLDAFSDPPTGRAEDKIAATSYGPAYDQPGPPAQPASHQSMQIRQKNKPPPGRLAEDWFPEDTQGGRRKKKKQ